MMHPLISNIARTVPIRYAILIRCPLCSASIGVRACETCAWPASPWPARCRRYAVVLIQNSGGSRLGAPESTIETRDMGRVPAKLPSRSS